MNDATQMTDQKFAVWQNQDMTVEVTSKKEDYPDLRKCLWGTIVNAPDATTAAHSATLRMFPADTAREILLNYLSTANWQLLPTEAEQVEAFDEFLCSLPGGADSVFKGFVKYRWFSHVIWIEEGNDPPKGATPWEDK